MSWYLFFLSIAVLYSLYYGTIIGIDLLKSDKQKEDYTEETEEVGLSNLSDEEDQDDEIPTQVDYTEEETDSTLKKEETPNLPEEEVNVQKSIVTQGIPLDVFSKLKEESQKESRALLR